MPAAGVRAIGVGMIGQNEMAMGGISLLRLTSQLWLPQIYRLAVIRQQGGPRASSEASMRWICSLPEPGSSSPLLIRT